MNGLEEAAGGLDLAVVFHYCSEVIEPNSKERVIFDDANGNVVERVSSA